MTNFKPNHLADLWKSGLSDVTIEQSGIKTTPPGQINKRLGVNLSGLMSCYEIPYPSCDGFSRYRCFYEEGKDGPKYLQKKDSGNHLYIPYSMTVDILNDPVKPLYLTEGEKKALKGCQEGMFCIGLPGLWNWKNKGIEGLIPDFDKILWEDRTVYIIPDNDYLKPDKHGYKKNLADAVRRLSYSLIERGAKVFIIQLPEGSTKGLDDYLQQHSVNDFKKLPKREIRMDKKSNRKKENSGMKITLEANLPGLVDVVLDGDVPAFLFNRDGKVTLEREIIVSPDEKIQPPGQEHFPFPLLPAEAITRAYRKEDDALFDDVMNYLKRHSYLTEYQYLICAEYIFLTYIHDHRDISYTPIILFYAVPERGKTRTGRAMIHISYRGVHCVDLRETNLFRYSHNLKSSLFIDAMNIWKKAERNQSEDVLLLRYEKGATVARVLYPERGQFKDTKYFDVYGPTVISSNEPLHKILSSRCIPFSMPNRPGFYENSTPEKGLPLKARLTAWRAKMMTSTLPAIDTIEGLNGRLWDITQPLLQICRVIAPGRYDDLVDALVDVAVQRGEERQESYEGMMVQIISEIYPKEADIWDVETGKITNEFNELLPEASRKTGHWVGRKLRELGLKTKKVGRLSRTYLSRREIETLKEQYGLSPVTKSSKSSIVLDSDNHIDNGVRLSKTEVFKVATKSCIVSDNNDNAFKLTDSLHDLHDLKTRSVTANIKEEYNVVKQQLEPGLIHSGNRENLREVEI